MPYALTSFHYRHVGSMLRAGRMGDVRAPEQLCDRWVIVHDL